MSRKFFFLILCGALLTLQSSCQSRVNSPYPIATKEQQLASFIELGSIRLMQKDLAGALSELSKAEKIDPENTEVLTFLGLTYYQRGDYDLATEYYLRVLALDQSRTEIHNNLGLIYMNQKNFAAAKREFETCLADKTYPKPYLPNYNLGLLEEAQGKIEEAEKIYQNLLIISPQYPPPFNRLGIIYYNRGEYRKAVDYLLSAVQLDAEYVEAYYFLAQAYEKLGLTEEAAVSYGQVVVLVPNTALAIEAQGRARKVLGFE